MVEMGGASDLQVFHNLIISLTLLTCTGAKLFLCGDLSASRLEKYKNGVMASITQFLEDVGVQYCIKRMDWLKQFRSSPLKGFLFLQAYMI
jgi:DNA-directed RNA polymerase subunit N (RpoN/RPB10)